MKNRSLITTLLMIVAFMFVSSPVVFAAGKRKAKAKAKGQWDEKLAGKDERSKSGNKKNYYLTDLDGENYWEVIRRKEGHSNIVKQYDCDELTGYTDQEILDWQLFVGELSEDQYVIEIDAGGCSAKLITQSDIPVGDYAIGMAGCLTGNCQEKLVSFRAYILHVYAEGDRFSFVNLPFSVGSNQFSFNVGTASQRAGGEYTVVKTDEFHPDRVKLLFQNSFLGDLNLGFSVEGGQSFIRFPDDINEKLDPNNTDTYQTYYTAYGDTRAKLLFGPSITGGQHGSMTLGPDKVCNPTLANIKEVLVPVGCDPLVPGACTTLFEEILPGEPGYDTTPSDNVCSEFAKEQAMHIAFFMENNNQFTPNEDLAYMHQTGWIQYSGENAEDTEFNPLYRPIFGDYFENPLDPSDKIEFPDTNGFNGLFTSIVTTGTEAAPIVHIAYREQTAGELRYARKSGASWSTRVLDGSNGAGNEGISIATYNDGVDDHIGIAYANVVGTISSLMYIESIDDGITWPVAAVTLDATGSVGKYASLSYLHKDSILDTTTGEGGIAYYDDTNALGDLKYLKINNGGVVGAPMVVDHGQNTHPANWPQEDPLLAQIHRDVGQYASLVIDRFDTPLITYFDAERLADPRVPVSALRFAEMSGNARTDTDPETGLPLRHNPLRLCGGETFDDTSCAWQGSLVKDSGDTADPEKTYGEFASIAISKNNYAYFVTQVGATEGVDIVRALTDPAPDPKTIEPWDPRENPTPGKNRPEIALIGDFTNDKAVGKPDEFGKNGWDHRLYDVWPFLIDVYARDIDGDRTDLSIVNSIGAQISKDGGATWSDISSYGDEGHDDGHPYYEFKEVVPGEGKVVVPGTLRPIMARPDFDERSVAEPMLPAEDTMNAGLPPAPLAQPYFSIIETIAPGPDDYCSDAENTATSGACNIRNGILRSDTSSIWVSTDLSSYMLRGQLVWGINKNDLLCTEGAVASTTDTCTGEYRIRFLATSEHPKHLMQQASSNMNPNDSSCVTAPCPFEYEYKTKGNRRPFLIVEKGVVHNGVPVRSLPAVADIMVTSPNDSDAAAWPTADLQILVNDLPPTDVRAGGVIYIGLNDRVTFDASASCSGLEDADQAALSGCPVASMANQHTGRSSHFLWDFGDTPIDLGHAEKYEDYAKQAQVLGAPIMHHTYDRAGQYVAILQVSNTFVNRKFPSRDIAAVRFVVDEMNIAVTDFPTAQLLVNEFGDTDAATTSATVSMEKERRRKWHGGVVTFTGSGDADGDPLTTPDGDPLTTEDDIVWYRYDYNGGKPLYDSETVKIEVETFRSNGPPTAQDGGAFGTQNTPVNDIVLVANDPEGDTLTYKIEGTPVGGTVSGTFPNNVTYTPDATTATGSFQFSANDGEYDSNIATINISLDGTPVANSQFLKVAVNSVGNEIILTATDPGGDPLTYQIVSGPPNGTLTGPSGPLGNKVYYTPNVDFVNNYDNFYFTATDDSGNVSSQRMVKICVGTCGGGGGTGGGGGGGSAPAWYKSIQMQSEL